MVEKLFGGIEAGGTKMICCVGTGEGKILDRYEFPTNDPESDIQKMKAYFADFPIEGVGAGWFGPLDLNPSSPSYGSVLSTPKPYWKNFPVKKVLEEVLGVPVFIETDVNAALLGEMALGAGQGKESAIYLTVGTGIGAGICVRGQLLQGVTHPEAGHIRLRRHPKDSFVGGCPYHKDCLEGLASGPSIEKRWGKPGALLAGEDIVWEIEADYIGQALADFVLIFGPQVIILGGGVMKQERLFAMIREKMAEYLADYVDLSLFGPLEEYILPAKLGGDQALVGCLQMAMKR